MFGTDTVVRFWSVEKCKFQNYNTIRYTGTQGRFINNTMIDAADDGISVLGIDNLVRDNLIINPGLKGIKVNPIVDGLTGVDAYFNGVTIEGNTILWSDSSSSRYGIYSPGWARRLIIRNNRIGSPGANGYTRGYFGYGIWVGYGEDFLIQNNWIYGAMTRGIHAIAYVDRALISDNHIWGFGPGSEGIRFGGFNGDYNVAKGNYIYNFNTGINIAGGTHNCHTENFFKSVITNISDSGSSTVTGDIRDLD